MLNINIIISINIKAVIQDGEVEDLGKSIVWFQFEFEGLRDRVIKGVVLFLIICLYKFREQVFQFDVEVGNKIKYEYKQ